MRNREEREGEERCRFSGGGDLFLLPEGSRSICDEEERGIVTLFPRKFQQIDALMESKGGKKKSSSSRSSLMYEAPLGYSIEDLRPAGGIKKFRSAAYSNCARKPS